MNDDYGSVADDKGNPSQGSCVNLNKEDARLLKEFFQQATLFNYQLAVGLFLFLLTKYYKN